MTESCNIAPISREPGCVLSINVGNCFGHAVGEGGSGEDVTAIVCSDELVDIIEGIEGNILGYD